MSKIEHISSHILKHLSIHRTTSLSPLFVAVQGPQGSGKSYLSDQVRNDLTSPSHNLSVVLVSIDDLYLPRRGLLDLAASYPLNPLLSGRGQPGTHDVKMAKDILERLKKINDLGETKEQISIPRFDKSLFDGYGDRADVVDVVEGPVDVVILEGWFVGFCPTTQNVIEERYSKPLTDVQGVFDMNQFKISDIFEINKLLQGYVNLWKMFDVFVQIKPPDATPYALIYKWRLQQEHNMKSKNGGMGMTDEQVKKFVDRYIPGYVFFSDGVELGQVRSGTGVRCAPTWRGKGLKIVIDEGRGVIGTDNF